MVESPIMWIVMAEVAEDEAVLLVLLALDVLEVLDFELVLLVALLEDALPASPPEPPPPPHALIPTASRSAAISVESRFILVSD
jgi:hypothetical protein